jgi:hypothetical protein
MFWTQWSTEEWIVNITVIVFIGLLFSFGRGDE